MSIQGNSMSSSERPTFLQRVDSLKRRFPILNYVTEFTEKQRRQRVYPVRAAVLEFRHDEVRKIEFDNKVGESAYDGLRTYLLSPPSSDCVHRLYLLEDLDASFIELLGGHLNVDGTVFGSQIRDTHFSGGWQYGHQPKLPSFRNPEMSFTLRYYEARYFNDPNMPEYSASVRTSGNLSRQIAFGRGRRTKFDGAVGLIGIRNYDGFVGLIRRNTSFWSRSESDGSWNGIILCDPSTHGMECIFSGTGSAQKPRHIVNHLYQGGYRDFLPWPTSPADLTMLKIRGPRRESLLQDVTFYWTTMATQSEIRNAITNPFHSTLFLRNIIASTWMNTLEYIQAVLSELETMLWHVERMISPELKDAEKDRYMHDFSAALNEINTMRRRLNWYVIEMKLNCEALGGSPDFALDGIQRDQDFVAIYNRLVSYQKWADRLLGVVTTHFSLMETEKSLSDSKALARLTVLGFFFIPASFVATFFSMGGDFSAGQPEFWVYFVVAIPVTVLTFVAAFGKWGIWWNKMLIYKDYVLAGGQKPTSTIVK